MVNKTKDFYDKKGKKWADIKVNSFFHEDQFRIFESRLRNKDSVLDIGCASGIHVPLFLGIGRKLKYEGLDISSTLLSVAESRYPQLSFLKGNIVDKKSLPNKKYDAFWAAAVLMHIPLRETNKMFNNIESLMNPKAIGYMTLPRKRLVKPSLEDQRHFEIYSKEKLEGIILKKNWKILDYGKFEPTPVTEWDWYIVQLP